MKKIILSLILMLTFGLSYGLNTDKEKINKGKSDHEVVISTPDNGNDINNINVFKTTEDVNVCVEVGAAVFQAANEAGHSLNSSLTLAFDAITACEVLILIGTLLNSQ